jgi:uncharacterized protein YjbJ (UPF0337 family)
MKVFASEQRLNSFARACSRGRQGLTQHGYGLLARYSEPVATRPEEKKGDVMNADTFKGKWGQFKGELKRQWGKFTDDDLTQIEGNYDKFLGKVQERYGAQKDDIAGWADKWFQGNKPDQVEREPVR